MKIRIGTFETNSSSTHSICIPENVDLDLYPELKGKDSFDLFEATFGWEIETYTGFYDKLHYLLLIYLDQYCEEKNIEKIEIKGQYGNSEILETLELTEENTKNSIFENLYIVLSKATGQSTINFKFDRKYFDGYVDHGCEYADSFLYIMNNEQILANFLLSSESELNTDNDNY